MRLKDIKQKLVFIVRTLQTIIAYPFFNAGKTIDYFNIPIIINNRNRLSYLKALINSLESRGYKNIHIIDNDSSFQPLLDFYAETNYTVYRLKDNVGFKALWDTDIFEMFKDNWYVYTDSDLYIVDDCPKDFLKFFLFLHKKYPATGKVGFGLATNDLPMHYKLRDKVIEWENNLLKKSRKLEKLANTSQIDTTFALYKKGYKGPAHTMACIRTHYPFEARHLPWYEDSHNLTEEQNYYYKTASTSTHWSKLSNNQK